MTSASEHELTETIRPRPRCGAFCFGPPQLATSFIRSIVMSDRCDVGLWPIDDRQEKIIALLRKSSLRPDVRFTLDDAIKQAEHDLDEYNALLTRYGRSGKTGIACPVSATFLRARSQRSTPTARECATVFTFSEIGTFVFSLPRTKCMLDILLRKTFMADPKRREVVESVLNHNQRREAEINDALRQDAARRAAVVKNMRRLRALRLQRAAINETLKQAATRRAAVMKNMPVESVAFGAD